jgi:hypothetical protein
VDQNELIIPATVLNRRQRFRQVRTRDARLAPSQSTAR